MVDVTSLPTLTTCGLAVSRPDSPRGTKSGTSEGTVAVTPARILPVLIQHEEEPMNRTLAALDREWTELSGSPASIEALERWSRSEPVLTGLPSLSAILEERRSVTAAAPALLAALARLAPDDELAARTLLQALVPGLLTLATTACTDDPLAFDEMVSLAWERIRTYPRNRPGSVAANVIWDVRKRYREHWDIEHPCSGDPEPVPAGVVPSAEEMVLGRSAVEDLFAAHRHGVISVAALKLILRTRVDEVPLEVAAREQRAASNHAANCVRWRAERRLRPVLAGAS